MMDTSFPATANRHGAAVTAAHPTQRLVAFLASRPALTDALLALLLAALSLPQLLSHRDLHDDLAAYVAGVALVAPLAWLRRRPAAVFAVTWTAGFALLLSGQAVVADLAVLIALYAVANRSPRRVATVAACATELGVVVSSLLRITGRSPALELPYLSAVVAAAYLLGVNVRTRRDYLTALVERAEAIESRREQEARVAAATERASIAREMHDIVAHSVAVMITMADAAARKGRSDPERAISAMKQVSHTGRQTLDETRRLLGVLRAESATDGRFMPHPGLAQLDALLEQVRATGLTTRLTITGEAFDVLEGAQLAAYRIVQEALTNTLKHAQGASCAEVRVHYARPAIEVDVTDDGHARPQGSPAAGHGLAGMRERAGLYDGTLVAGRCPQGGWSVAARLERAAAS